MGDTARKLAHSRDIIEQAIDEHEPTKVFALFSGGGDSQVMSHVSREYIDALVHIDTGTALPGVRKFVEGWADKRGIPLLVYEAGRAFEWLVTRRCAHLRFTPLGFPGYGQHGTAYYYLKQKQIDAVVRDHKEDPKDRILLLTGVRQNESARRALIMTKEVRRDGAKVWANPILDWDNKNMRAYKARYRLRPSDVSALMHMSGECMCGAFAKPDERAMVFQLFPEWAAWIKALEEEAARVGAEHSEWGWSNKGKTPRGAEEVEPDPEFKTGLLCSDCEPN